jgi:Phage integrase family
MQPPGEPQLSLSEWAVLCQHSSAGPVKSPAAATGEGRRAAESWLTRPAGSRRYRPHGPAAEAAGSVAAHSHRDRRSAPADDRIRAHPRASFAGLRETRLHDARHTAATVLLALRQPTPTVMSLMGWSSESMAARYQHLTDAMRTQVASEVGDLIWADPEQARPTPMLTVRRDSLAVVVAANQRGRACRGSQSRPRTSNE